MKARILDPDEWGKLSVTGFPAIIPLVNPPDTEVIVVEDGERIVASMAVMRLTHFEAAFVDPEYKANPGVIRALLAACFESSNRFPEEWAMALADDPRVSSLLAKMGGVKMDPLDIFIVPTREKKV